jgi:FkbM family methyltransferase
MLQLIYNLYHSLKLRKKFGSKPAYFFSLIALSRKAKDTTNKLIQHKILGYNISAYSYNNLNFLFREIFIAEDYYLPLSFDKPVIIDCGANIGMSVLYFKKLFQNAVITAFEANTHTYELLQKNVVNNNLQDVSLHNVALYDKEGEISFFIGEDIGTLVGSVRSDRGGTKEMKVKSKLLSSFLIDTPSIDILKMDVEGAEHNIVKDLYESGALSKVKNYVIEYHHNVNKEASRLSGFLKMFEENGYSYTIKTTYISPEGFQDILIYFFKR